jgi:tetratricopeptide (TPR) repeat protein
MEALFIRNLTVFYRGDFTGSLEACREGLALYDAERCRLHSQHTGQNSGVTHQCYGALSLWHLGFPEQAVRMGKNAVALAREIQHPFSLAYALHHLGWLYQHLRNPVELFQCSNETLELATKQGFIFWMAESHLCRGYGFLLRDDFAMAEQEILEGLEIFKQSGAALSLSHFYATLAEIRFRLDDKTGAFDWIAKALEASARFGNTFHLSEIHRLHGEFLVTKSLMDAEQHFQKSLEVARQQRALSCELRAALSLARLRQQQGQLTEGANLLEAVCRHFQEGHQSPDYQEARLLITSLR